MEEKTPAWKLPDEPAPVRLMNTVWADPHGVHDALPDPSALRDWLADVTDYDGATPSRAEFADALALRDSLRRLAAYCTSDERPTAQSPVGEIIDAIAVVNRIVDDLPRTKLSVHGRELRTTAVEQASRIRSALADVARQGIELLTGPTSLKLRACDSAPCVLYFVKSHPRREWCSETCGNRVRAARHYARVRDAR